MVPKGIVNKIGDIFRNILFISTQNRARLSNNHWPFSAMFNGLFTPILICILNRPRAEEIVWPHFWSCLLPILRSLCGYFCFRFLCKWNSQVKAAVQPVNTHSHAEQAGKKLKTKSKMLLCEQLFVYDTTDVGTYAIYVSGIYLQVKKHLNNQAQNM